MDGENKMIFEKQPSLWLNFWCQGGGGDYMCLFILHVFIDGEGSSCDRSNSLILHVIKIIQIQFNGVFLQMWLEHALIVMGQSSQDKRELLLWLRCDLASQQSRLILMFNPAYTPSVRMIVIKQLFHISDLFPGLLIKPDFNVKSLNRAGECSFTIFPRVIMT